MLNWADRLASAPKPKPVVYTDGPFDAIRTAFLNNKNAYAPLVGKPCLGVDLFFDQENKAFHIFSLYQDDEGTPMKELASLNIDYTHQLMLLADKYNDISNSTLQLVAYGRHVAVTSRSKTKEFGISWLKKSELLVNKRKAVVLIHGYVLGWPDYLKGYKFD
ncbi:hypothetical protein FOL47_008730 [Perkinsus chesapeaki]|uniref:Uncharacterized protein n=1 Tax=Perkinsus chesapeaki TaxID=330153 RepID=A0A7J6LC54_PERCH|nr:hypothetical protein FOL47_008730 [Perkinsus chesapeaki]